MRKHFFVDRESEAEFAHFFYDLYVRAICYEECDAELMALGIEEPTGEDDPHLCSWEVLSYHLDEASFAIYKALRSCSAEALSMVWAIAKIGESEIAFDVAYGNADTEEGTPPITRLISLPDLCSEFQIHVPPALFIKQILSMKNLSCALSKGAEIACDNGFFSDTVRGIFDSWGVI